MIAEIRLIDEESSTNYNVRIRVHSISSFINTIDSYYGQVYTLDKNNFELKGTVIDCDSQIVKDIWDVM